MKKQGTSKQQGEDSETMSETDEVEIVMTAE